MYNKKYVAVYDEIHIQISWYAVTIYNFLDF